MMDLRVAGRWDIKGCLKSWTFFLPAHLTFYFGSVSFQALRGGSVVCFSQAYLVKSDEIRPSPLPSRRRGPASFYASLVVIEVGRELAEVPASYVQGHLEKHKCTREHTCLNFALNP